MKWERAPSSGVIPKDSPTVPIADAVSNNAAIRGIRSTLLMIIPPARNNVIYMEKIVDAFLIVSSGILLPKKMGVLFFLEH